MIALAIGLRPQAARFFVVGKPCGFSFIFFASGKTARLFLAESPPFNRKECLVNTVTLSAVGGKSLTVFSSEKFGEIRSMVIGGEPYFVGRDIAKALGYKDSSDAVKKHVDEDDRMGGRNTDPYILDSMNRKQYPVFINESGVYALIFGSKLESAREFKHWVTSEVLPSIRKTGGYYASPKRDFAKEKEIAFKRAELLREIGLSYEGKAESYRQILDAYATKELTGDFLLPLPRTEKTYSAGEIGKILGVSANMVGRIANARNLKTDVFGIFVLDKSRFSEKEVQSFRYNDNGLEEIRKTVKENKNAKSEEK